MTKPKVRIPLKERDTGVKFTGQSAETRHRLEIQGTDKRLSLDERRLQAQRRIQAIATLNKNQNPEVAEVARRDVRRFQRLRGRR